MSDATKLNARLAARHFGGPDAVPADRETPGPSLSAILKEVTALARREYPDAETGQFIVSDEIILRLGGAVSTRRLAILPMGYNLFEPSCFRESNAEAAGGVFAAGPDQHRRWLFSPFRCNISSLG